MDALRLCGLAVAGALAALTLRQLKPGVGLAVSLFAGVMVLVALLPTLRQAVEGITSLASQGGLSDGYLTQLLKVGGVSLLMDFSAQTCRDAGEAGLAMKVELAGRVMLIGLSLPYMEALLAQILSLCS